MQRRRRILAIARIVLVMASVAMGSFAELRVSAAAMACCAEANNQCARLSPPDDCCQRMGHATAPNLADIVSSTQPHALPAVTAVDFSQACNAAGRFANKDETFARPHDPPYLHTYSLLI